MGYRVRFIGCLLYKQAGFANYSGWSVLYLTRQAGISGMARDILDPVRKVVQNQCRWSSSKAGTRGVAGKVCKMRKALIVAVALGFSGGAYADSHMSFEFPVDFEFGLNDLVENGLYITGDADIIGRFQLGDNIRLKVSLDGDIRGFNQDLNWDKFFTFELSWGDATLSAGNVDSAAEDYFNSVTGMNLNNSAVTGDETGFFKQSGEYVVRFDVDIGDISLSISGDSPSFSIEGPIENPSIGLSGSIGELDFNLAFDELGDKDVTTVIGADIAFDIGDFAVEMAYQQDGEGDTAFGVALDGSIGQVGVAAYYSVNSSNWDVFGASASARLGEVDAGVYWSGSASGYSNVGIDLKFDIAENVRSYLGYDQADGFYIGAIMEAGEDIQIGLSVAQNASDQKHGPKDFKDGMTLWFSSSF